ncbi:MAG: GNAT family N-acetyltransferase [Phycisphaerales bacterium]
MSMEVTIDRLDPGDTETIAHLYNQMFRPARTPESFARRFLARRNVLVLVARIKTDAVGFYVGLELKPSVHFAWLCGVMPDARRQGVATQLMHEAMSWAKDQGYSHIRFECLNKHRPFLHFGIAEGFDIVGIRWDADMSENLVIFEKGL